MDTTFTRGLIALSIAFALTGCSAGPSQSDTQKAVEAEFSKMFGPALQSVAIQDFKMSGCRKAEGADGYDCDVTGNVGLNVAGSQQTRALKGNFRFVQAGDAWQVLDK